MPVSDPVTALMFGMGFGSLLTLAVVFVRPTPKCPRCKLMRCEAISTNCTCAFAKGQDQ